VLSPLHVLIADIIDRGIDEGVFSDEVDVNTTAALIMQTALGAMRLRVLWSRTERRADRWRAHLHVLCPRAREVTFDRP
jgi:hypothetical protein